MIARSSSFYSHYYYHHRHHRHRYHHQGNFSMSPKPRNSNLDEFGNMHLDERLPVKVRRNAIIPFVLQDAENSNERAQPRRNAIAPFLLQGNDDDDESDEIQVSHSRSVKQKDPAAAESMQSAPASTSATAPEQKARKQKDQPQKSDKPDSDDGIHYIRVGRRPTEDESGDIPTQFIVVARIDSTKNNKISWLSVATWQLNGFRIGTVGSGDRIRKDDEVLNYAVGLNPDPFFVARNAASTRGIPELLLERLARGEVGVQEETLSDRVAQRERSEAQSSRMLDEHGPAVVYGGDKAVRKIAARGDARLRFPHPWALPVALTRSVSRFPAVLDGFVSVASDVAISSIHVVANFANEIDGGRDLRLKHFMQVAFEPDETLESAKCYFLKGDESTEFRGLESNRFLAKTWWLLELWVLPHCQGCSTLYKWNDTPELTARAFCDANASKRGWSVEPKLYVEARIVQDPDHLGGESEEDISSSSSDDEREAS